MIFRLLFPGIVAFPTALVNNDNNPVKCTPCIDGICPSDSDEDTTSFLTSGNWNWTGTSDLTTGIVSGIKQTTGAADFNQEWVDAYCVINEMTVMVQYFPYFVLILALTLCVVQKMSNK